MLVVTIWCACLVMLVKPAVRRPTERHIASFAELYAVRLTPATCELIASSLLWTRRWRVAGGIVGGATWWAAHPDGTPFNPFAIATGMAVGNLLAEVLWPTTERGVVRAADIARRSVTDHVQRFVVVGLVVLWWLAAIVLVVAAAGVTVPDGLTTFDLVVGIAALVVGGSALPLAGLVARRPAPRDDPAEAAVRHAIRSAGISAVLGGGAIVLGSGMYRTAFAAVLADSDLSAVVRHLDNVAMWVALAGVLAGVSLVFGSFPRRLGRRSEAVAA